MNAERKEKKSKDKDRLEYSRVVKSAQLREILLLGSSFDVDRSFMEGLEPENDDGISLDFTYGTDVPGVKYDSEKGVLVGQFDWYARAEKDDHKAIGIRGLYAIIYDCDVDLDEEACEQFVLRVGKFATFPYFRQLVGFYGNAASLELPILPVLKE